MSAKRSFGFDPVRAFQIAALVLFEATLIYLVVTLLMSGGGTSPVRWWVLAMVVGASVGATALFEPYDGKRSHIRPSTATVGLLVVGLSVALHIQVAGGGFGLFGTLRDPDSPQFTVAYTALIASIIGWWRGSSLLEVGHGEMVPKFRRAIIAVMLALVVQTISGYGQGLTPRVGATGLNVPASIVAFLLLGLLCLSVTRITTVEGDGGRAAQMMWLRGSILSSGAILLLGVVVLALVASPAGALLQGIAAVFISVLSAILVPFIWLATTILEVLRNTFLPDGVTLPMPIPTATAQDDGAQPLAPVDAGGLLSFLTILLLLIPVAVLVLLVVFATRRRSKPAPNATEERESIFTWSGFGSDIGSLLGMLRRRPSDEGLQGALRRLIAADPATRIRRRYVQLLLQGEAADKHRRAPQTPREFAPTLDAVARDHAALDELTKTYEQARYAPEFVAEADAERAERAWQSLSGDRR